MIKIQVEREIQLVLLVQLDLNVKQFTSRAQATVFLSINIVVLMENIMNVLMLE
jgi:hypothetical protein